MATSTVTPVMTKTPVQSVGKEMVRAWSDSMIGSLDYSKRRTGHRRVRPSAGEIRDGAHVADINTRENLDTSSHKGGGPRCVDALDRALVLQVGEETARRHISTQSE